MNVIYVYPFLHCQRHPRALICIFTLDNMHDIHIYIPLACTLSSVCTPAPHALSSGVSSTMVCAEYSLPFFSSDFCNQHHTLQSSYAHAPACMPPGPPDHVNSHALGVDRATGGA